MMNTGNEFFQLLAPHSFIWGYQPSEELTTSTSTYSSHFYPEDGGSGVLQPTYKATQCHKTQDQNHKFVSENTKEQYFWQYTPKVSFLTQVWQVVKFDIRVYTGETAGIFTTQQMEWLEVTHVSSL